MNTPESELLPDDLLFDIQRRIARRADELARAPHSPSPSHDYWWQAECEVLEQEDLELVASSPTEFGR